MRGDGKANIGLRHLDVGEHPVQVMLVVKRVPGVVRRNDVSAHAVIRVGDRRGEDPSLVKVGGGQGHDLFVSVTTDRFQGRDFCLVCDEVGVIGEERIAAEVVLACAEKLSRRKLVRCRLFAQLHQQMRFPGLGRLFLKPKDLPRVEIEMPRGQRVLLLPRLFQKAQESKEEGVVRRVAVVFGKGVLQGGVGLGDQPGVGLEELIEYR